MPIAINGSGTITGISAGGLPDGVITTDDIAASAITRAKMGYAGAILQVVQGTSTTSTSTSSTSFVSANLSASITPTSTSSKVLVSVQGGGADNGSSGRQIYLTIYRNSTNIGLGSVSSLANTYAESSRTIVPISLSYLDSPSTTSSVAYTLYFRLGGAGTAVITGQNEGIVMTLMEVAA